MNKIFFKIITDPQFDIIINNNSLRIVGFNAIPSPIIDNILLTFPWMYRLKIVNYETVLSLKGGISEVLSKIDQTKNIEGNIIECGCARCGTTVIIGNHIKKNKIEKIIYAFDSFEGFRKEEIKKEKWD